jgi:transcriptional regulator with XRE-family HTH domain
MEIGKLMLGLRKEKKWSQADVASKIGTSQVMIGRYERGDTIPSIEVAREIARAFGVTLDYLAGEGQNASFDKETLTRLENIERLPQKKKEQLFELIDVIIRDHYTEQAYGKK